MARRLLVLCTLLCGCRLDVDYTGTRYRCSLSADCPGDMRCLKEVCSTEAATDGPDAALPAGADAAAVDAPPRPDAEPADAGPPPNLLDDPGFEASEDGWTGYLATAGLTSTNAHSGTHALRVCKNASGHRSFFSVYRELIVDDPAKLPAGAHFHAEAWVRASGLPADVAPGFIAPSLRERGGAQPFLNHYGASLTPVTTAWTLVQVDAVIGESDRTGLSFILETGSESDGTCFHVDDAYVYRVD